MHGPFDRELTGENQQGRLARRITDPARIGACRRDGPDVDDRASRLCGAQRKSGACDIKWPIQVEVDDRMPVRQRQCGEPASTARPAPNYNTVTGAELVPHTVPLQTTLPTK